MFTDFKTGSLFSFGSNHPLHMFSHNSNSLAPSWYIIIRQKTPRISEYSSSDHKSREILHFTNTIIIVLAISISEYWYCEIFLEFKYGAPICFASVLLLKCPAMHCDKLCSSIFKSFAKFYQSIGIIPSKTCFDAYGDTEIFG